MTRLSKPVTRWVDFGRGPVAVTLDPSGLITFREKGRRASYAIPLSVVFVRAVVQATEASKAERKANKKEHAR